MSFLILDRPGREILDSLCDGVGLGKTFVGLMLIEQLILHEGKRVALFAPKAVKEGVWESHPRHDAKGRQAKILERWGNV